MYQQRLKTTPKGCHGVPKESPKVTELHPKASKAARTGFMGLDSVRKTNRHGVEKKRKEGEKNQDTVPRFGQKLTR